MKYRIRLIGPGNDATVQILDREDRIIAEMSLSEWAFMISRPV